MNLCTDLGDDAKARSDSSAGLKVFKLLDLVLVTQGPLGSGAGSEVQEPSTTRPEADPDHNGQSA